MATQSIPMAPPATERPGPIGWMRRHLFATPFDMFSFYQDKASPAAFQVLAVPAASFADKMTAAPDEPELLRLFNERKDYEPDPSKAEPGFKEPRRVKVEWVGASGAEPYYQKAAADWVARAEQLLGLMDDTYDALSTVDYPDAVTHGLRRTLDALRAVLERSRGDLTTSVLQLRLQQAIESDRP